MAGRIQGITVEIGGDTTKYRDQKYSEPAA